MKPQNIIMADIIGSKEIELETYEQFKRDIDGINQAFSGKLLSPLTVTLGDEFQGIAKTKKDSIELIFAIEEAMLLSGIQLRYVYEQGVVESPINPEHAHAMVGPGLTKARKDLEELKKTDDRFFFHLQNKDQAKKLNLAFHLYKSIVDDWYNRKGDAALAHDFLKIGDYRKVAEMHQKDSSSTWRKEKSLKIKEYHSIKSLIYLIIGSKIAI